MPLPQRPLTAVTQKTWVTHAPGEGERPQRSRQVWLVPLQVVPPPPNHPGLQLQEAVCQRAKDYRQATTGQAPAALPATQLLTTGSWKVVPVCLGSKCFLKLGNPLCPIKQGPQELQVKKQGCCIRRTQQAISTYTPPHLLALQALGRPSQECCQHPAAQAAPLPSNIITEGAKAKSTVHRLGPAQPLPGKPQPRGPWVDVSWCPPTGSQVRFLQRCSGITHDLSKRHFGQHCPR